MCIISDKYFSGVILLILEGKRSCGFDPVQTRPLNRGGSITCDSGIKKGISSKDQSHLLLSGRPAFQTPTTSDTVKSDWIRVLARSVFKMLEMS